MDKEKIENETELEEYRIKKEQKKLVDDYFGEDGKE